MPMDQSVTRALISGARARLPGPGGWQRADACEAVHPSESERERETERQRERARERERERQRERERCRFLTKHCCKGRWLGMAVFADSGWSGPRDHFRERRRGGGGGAGGGAREGGGVREGEKERERER